MVRFIKNVRKKISIFIMMCLLVSLIPCEVKAEESLAEIVSEVQGNTYYVDSFDGDDTNSGTAIASPWKTLEKVNQTTFLPGDRILLKAGGSWNGQLWPKGSGEDGAPIQVDMYGEGAKPIINGGGVADTVYLYNQEYWEIGNLEVTNISETEDVREGIHVVTDVTNQFLHHIVIKDCYVHDVTGTMSRKDTGGIFVVGNYDGVLVENNTVRNVYRTGILTRAKRNVVIRNNMVDSIGGDGIQVGGGSMSPLVEYNVAKDCYNRYTAGEYNVAIWPYDTNNAVLQYNEAYLTHTTLDGQGFDCDYLCNGTIFQYNYSHDNEGGFMLICSIPNAPDYESYNRNSIIRYNISQNDRNRIFQIHSKGTQGTQIYNNTIYIGEGLSPKIYDFDTFRRPGAVYSYNNIFYNAGRGTYSYGLQNYHVFENNLFYGYHPSSEPSDPYKITSDPLLVAPGTGGTGWNTTTGYQLKADSPAINAGKYIENNGGKDYWGNALYNGEPDIGAHEYYGEIYPEVTRTNTGLIVNHTETGTLENQITYTGNWQSTNNDHWSDEIGATYSLNFYGNRIKVYGPGDPAHGIMAVSIDGGAETMVDTYAPERQSGVLYDSGLISLGSHVLTVRVTGEKNDLSSGSYVDVQKIEILPKFKTVLSYDAGAKEGMIDYYGDWRYGDNDSWSSTEGDYYQMTFRGSTVRVIGVKDVEFATIGISLDGGEETLVSTSANSRQENCLLFEAEGLNEGVHTVKVRLVSPGNHSVNRLEYIQIQD